MLRKQEGCKMLSSNSLILHLKLDFASRLHSATSESSTPILYDSVAQLKDIIHTSVSLPVTSPSLGVGMLWDRN